MNLDYTALKQTVTKQEIAAFKNWRGVDKYKNAKRAVIIILFTIFLLLLLITVTEFVISRSLSLALSIMTTTQGIAAILIVYIVVSGSKKLTRLYKFAKSNNLELIVEAENPPYEGMIFNRGNNRSILEAYKFPNGIEIGNYKYVIGGGKSSTIYNWGYARVKLSRNLPHMILDAKQNNSFGFSNLPDGLQGQELLLEGDFNDHFTLYVPESYGRDALYVFTPDVMTALIDSGSAYDIEIIDDMLLLYSKENIRLDSELSLTQLLKIIDRISKEIQDQSQLYSDERIEDKTINSIAEPGRRLQKTISVKAIYSFIVVLVSFILLFIYDSNF